MATLGYGVYLLHIPLCDHAVAPLARKLVKDSKLADVRRLAAVGHGALRALARRPAYVLHVTVEKPWLRIRDKVAR